MWYPLALFVKPFAHGLHLLAGSHFERACWKEAKAVPGGSAVELPFCRMENASAPPPLPGFFWCQFQGPWGSPSHTLRRTERGDDGNPGGLGAILRLTDNFCRHTTTRSAFPLGQKAPQPPLQAIRSLSPPFNIAPPPAARNSIDALRTDHTRLGEGAPAGGRRPQARLPRPGRGPCERKAGNQGKQNTQSTKPRKIKTPQTV